MGRDARLQGFRRPGVAGRQQELHPLAWSEANADDTRRPNSAAKGPEVDVVLVAKGIGADPVLLIMVRAAEAYTEDVMRPLTRAGIGG